MLGVNKLIAPQCHAPSTTALCKRTKTTAMETFRCFFSDGSSYDYEDYAHCAYHGCEIAVRPSAAALRPCEDGDEDESEDTDEGSCQTCDGECSCADCSLGGNECDNDCCGFTGGDEEPEDEPVEPEDEPEDENASDTANPQTDKPMNQYEIMAACGALNTEGDCCSVDFGCGWTRNSVDNSIPSSCVMASSLEVSVFTQRAQEMGLLTNLCGAGSSPAARTISEALLVVAAAVITVAM